MSPKETLEDFLIRRWLPAIRATVRPSTFAGYSGHVRNYIGPRLGDCSLGRLEPESINGLYAELLSEGLSPGTVRRVHATLHRALRDAVRWGLASDNAAARSDPPKLVSLDIHATWSSAELRRFLDVAARDDFAPLWRVLATTGMRRGEAIGLRWQDVDLTRGVLAIRHSLVLVSGCVMSSRPKTPRGRRVVALDRTTVRILKKHRRKTAYGGPQDLVVCAPDGGPLDPSQVTRRFLKIAEGAGLPRIRLHDLRHTHATLALGAGVHPKIVSERLGHSTIAFTLDVYSHAIPHMQAAAAEEIARLIDGSRNPR